MSGYRKAIRWTIGVLITVVLVLLWFSLPRSDTAKEIRHSAESTESKSASRQTDSTSEKPTPTGSVSPAVVSRSPSRKPEDLPTLPVLIDKVTGAMRPKAPFQAQVQQVTTSIANTVVRAKLRSASTQTFNVVFDFNIGKFVPKETVVGTEPTSHVTSNIIPFLNQVQTWPDVEIAWDTNTAHQLIKVTADSGKGLSSILLIDAKDFYVPSAKMFIQGKQFADTAFRYRNEEGTWLPERTTIDYVADGSRVVQDYSR